MKIKILISIFILSSAVKITGVEADFSASFYLEKLKKTFPSIDPSKTPNQLKVTSLHLTNDLDEAKTLINKDSIHAQDFYKNTPLHTTDNPEIAKLLIEHGADINASNAALESPLHTTHNPEIAKLLIEHGADINAQNFHKNTPLQTTDNPEIAKMLILAGANIPDDIKTRFPNNDEINETLQYISNLANTDTVKRFYHSKNLQDLALKKMYEDYLHGDRKALEEILLDKNVPDKFKDAFKPEFVQKVFTTKNPHVSFNVPENEAYRHPSKKAKVKRLSQEQKDKIIADRVKADRLKIEEQATKFAEIQERTQPNDHAFARWTREI